MTAETLKIVIPMAGLGTRLRPFTYSKPKQLITVAGKTVLAHVLDMLSTLPASPPAEFIFVVGHLAEMLPPYMAANHPDLKVRYVEQPEPKGQSHAIYLAREYLRGPMLMVFADTLIDTDLSFLADEPADAVAWVNRVEDPRTFGVAVVDETGRVVRLVEKPRSMENRLAVVGFYYFKQSEALVEAISEQMEQRISLNGEYFLADAVNVLLQRGLHMRTQPVGAYFDAGSPEDLLATNRYLLASSHDNSAALARRADCAIIPPVHIHPSAVLQGSVIGPSVSIGAGCRVQDSVVRDSILEAGAEVHSAVLEGSLLGENARVQGRASIINAGDQSVVNI